MSLKHKILSLFILCSCVFCFCASSDTLDAGKNATLHNNLGINYLKENNYVGAIKEFQIAIQLNPKSQVTATYYYNLGMVYTRLRKYKDAKSCYEMALKINPLYFRYYVDTVKTYKALNILDKELQKHLKEKGNPLNDLYIGLIYIEQGKKSIGITTLDNFCANEPNLMITDGVRTYLNQMSKN